LSAGIRRESHPNGLVLVTERMDNIRSVALGVWMKKGSRHETLEQNGISHFIEHLLFKGTENRTAKEIALIIDSVGGQMDAFTTKENTCFYFKVLDKNLDVAVDLLSDIIRHPRFEPEDIEKERKVIYEEIKMVDDTADELVYDIWSEAHYGDHPLGRPIQGTMDSVGRMRPDMLTRYFRDSYRPANLLVTAAGSLDHDKLEQALGAAFAGLNGHKEIALGPLPTSRSLVTVRDKKELGQLHLCLGLPGVKMDDDRRFPLYVLNTLLGGAMSSRLFQHVREERGLAYSVYSSANSYLDTGTLLVYAATSPESGREVMDLVHAELKRLKETPVTDAELKLAKDHLKGNLMLSLESSSSRMSNLARQEIYFGRHFGLDEILNGIDAVEHRHLMELAQDLFDPERSTLAVLGNAAGTGLDSVRLAF
ncbi:MAG TPA: pitrilysin family protein, partial [Candidatus Polarisedimenticolia bacterium]|nr:pitrilysin family protein [Candidatus Polarisedimenticolia bacterium]